MTDIAVRCDRLGKLYRIGAAERRHETLTGSVAAFLRSPVSNFRQLRRLSSFDDGDGPDTIWALKDACFQVPAGEVVGIIGANGAGKSTLLKILARIVAPTTGRAEVNGRLASLLEVGTGFHPDLTGRENVYLNGTILGMKRRELDAKFAPIVEFAGVERFIDTPVKRYSSGMRMRLAFSVAAHLEPEILLIDEVLAVGDAQFQQKCLGKLSEVAAEGRTVLFVSHNMGAISTLTRRTLWLDSGAIRLDGTTTDAVAAYIDSAYHRRGSWEAPQLTDKPIQILSVRLQSSGSSHDAAEFRVDSAISIEIQYVVRRAVRGAVVAVNIHAVDGAHLVSLEDIDDDPALLLERGPGLYTTTVMLPAPWLHSGSYLMRVGCGIPRVESFENIEALRFTLVETGDPTRRSHRHGYLLPMLSWRTEKIAATAGKASPAPGVSS